MPVREKALGTQFGLATVELLKVTPHLAKASIITRPVCKYTHHLLQPRKQGVKCSLSHTHTPSSPESLSSAPATPGKFLSSFASVNHISREAKKCNNERDNSLSCRRRRRRRPPPRWPQCSLAHLIGLGLQNPCSFFLDSFPHRLKILLLGREDLTR